MDNCRDEAIIVGLAVIFENQALMLSFLAMIAKAVCKNVAEGQRGKLDAAIGALTQRVEEMGELAESMRGLLDDE